MGLGANGAAAPLVDVVVPAYNAGREIDAVLECLAGQSALGRARVTVVDDGSTDDTGARLESFARGRPWLTVLRQPNLGRAAARNRGLAVATAPLVAFLDADILVDAEWLGRHLAAQQARPGMVMGEIVQGGEGADGPADGLYDLCAAFGRFSPGGALAWVCVTAGNLSAPRDAVLACGGFDTGFSGWGPEDLELAYRLVRAGLGVTALGGPASMHLRPRRGLPLDRTRLFEQLVYFHRKHESDEVRAYIQYVTGRLSCEELYAATTGRRAPPGRTYFRPVEYFADGAGGGER
jgi:glycosyltransferase involved in cell wall biosynthesis